MSEYNAYGELYDQRPQLIIHDRLRNSGTIRELIAMAKEANYDVSFSRGPFRNDMLVKDKGRVSESPESYSITSGMRYFKKINELRR